MESIRCSCNRLLARAAGDFVIEIKCPRCGVLNRTVKAASLPRERPGASDAEVP